jgi:hypothetical protein
MYFHVYEVCLTCRRVLDLMIVFIDALYTQLVIASNCRVIAISTSCTSLLHPIMPSVFTNRILATHL